MRSACVAAGALAALVMPGTGATAQAAAGLATAASAPAAHPAAHCHYVVTGNHVAVRRAPDRTAHRIKYKNRGDRVTGPCIYYYNDSHWWTEVYLGRGGSAWMASAFLRRS